MRLKGRQIYIEEGLREEDYPLILEGYRDLSVIGFVNFARETVNFKTAAEAKAFVNGVENETVWGIYTHEDKFIGYATLEPEGKDACEYAIFILDKDCWGKGLGEEVTQLMLGHIFQTLGYEKVVLTTSEHHKKAIALYEKMGFRKVRTVPNDRKIYLNGKWISSGTVEMEKLRNKTRPHRGRFPKT